MLHKADSGCQGGKAQNDEKGSFQKQFLTEEKQFCCVDLSFLVFALSLPIRDL